MSPMGPMGYASWLRTLLTLQQQQQLSASMMGTASGNGNGAASSPPPKGGGISGHDDSDMENHFKSGENQGYSLNLH